MTTTVEAVYEDGALKLLHPVPLKEHARVIVEIRPCDETADTKEREAWLRLSEQTLTRAWADPGDDVFNELLDR